MGFNRRAQEREGAAISAAEEARRAEVERKSAADANKIVGIRSARQADGRALWFYPMIGAAIAACFPSSRSFSSAAHRLTGCSPSVVGRRGPSLILADQMCS